MAIDDDAPAWNDDTEVRDHGPDPRPKWKILVVDDEPAVHSVTRLAIERLVVDGVPLQIYSSASAKEGRELLDQHPDAALLLLDVVMETDDAGLRLVDWLRRERGNGMLRIVLRTGQPGLAPEMEVMAGYDINDYLSKTEVTTQRLITAVMAGVRAYRDLRMISIQRLGLRRVIDATATLFDTSSVEQLLTGILEQVAGLLLPRESTVFFVARLPLFEPTETVPKVLAASGRFADSRGQPISEILDDEVMQDVERSLAGKGTVERGLYSVYSFDLGDNVRPVLYVDGGGALEFWESQLVSLYCANAALALRNHHLHAEREQWLVAFERVVPASLVSLVAKGDLRRVQVGDHIARNMTVMFMDVIGFTSRCERMAPPDAFALVNQLYAVIGPCIERHGGVIDKYLGDGVMVLFPGGPAQGVDAALAAFAEIDRFNAEISLADGPLEMAIGVHHGPVIAGMVGHQRRMTPTVIADTVNTASRIQDFNRVLGTRLLTSGRVAHDLDPTLARRSLGPISLRGRSQSIELVEIYQNEAPLNRARKATTAATFAAALGCLDERDLPGATALFETVVRDDPGDTVARHFLACCHAE